MKINILILCTLIIIAVAASYWHTHKKPSQNIITKKINYDNNNEIIANIEFQLLSGKDLKLHDIKNKVVIIHFWSTWCAPCIVELPEMMKLADQEKDLVTIIAVSVNKNESDINRFLKKLNLDIPDNFLIAHDPQKAISQDIFKTIKLPESFILSPNYELHKKIIGASDDWLSDNKTDLLRKLSKNSE